MSVFVNEVRPSVSVGAAPPVLTHTHDELASMTVSELRAVCEECGIKTATKTRKADLIASIESATSHGGDSA